jgi:predicted phage terminase large subunit-like protein
MGNATAKSPELARRLLRVTKLRREVVRRNVLEHGRIDLLAGVLGYDIQSGLHDEILKWQDSSDENMTLAPRGFGKSTVGTILRSIYEILRNPNIRILIASKTAHQASRFLREIAAHFEYNTELRAIFGDHYSDRKWTATEITVATRTKNLKESTITTLGVGGPVASGHYDLIICDDLTDRKNTRTDLQRTEMHEWFFQVLAPAIVDKNSRIFILGTPYHPLDLSTELEKRGYPCKRWKAELSGKRSAWPSRFPWKKLQTMRRRFGSTAYASQYMMQTDLMEGDIFKREWIQRYPDDTNFDNHEVWVGCDPAATKQSVLTRGDKVKTDYWTICVASRWRCPETGNLSPEIFIRYLWRDHVTKAAYLSQLISVYEVYAPQVVAIESNAAQEYLIQDAMAHMPVRRIERVNDKVSRAYGIQAFFENGQILFPEKTPHEDDVWEAAIDELVLFPNAEHDDLFDSIETAIQQAFGSGVDAFVA